MKQGNKRTKYAVWVGCTLVFVGIYKLTAYYGYSGHSLLGDEWRTHYGGIQTGEFLEFRQTGTESCGQAAAAFFLSKVGIPENETSVINRLGTAGMVSLGDLNRLFLERGFKTQALKVEPAYFKRHPATAILHLTERHFVVFIREEEGKPLIFDPAYGLVSVGWNYLTKVFSGYMLYVYRE